MNVQETAALIAVIGTFDARAIPTDDLSLQAKVTAWQAALEPHVTYPAARDVVLAHYRRTSDPITVAAINLRLRPPEVYKALPVVPAEPNSTYRQARAAIGSRGAE